KGKSFSIAELAAAGVKRISLATSLYRAAMTGFLDAIAEIKDTGGVALLRHRVGRRGLLDIMGRMGPRGAHRARCARPTAGRAPPSWQPAGVHAQRPNVSRSVSSCGRARH